MSCAIPRDNLISINSGFFDIDNLGDTIDIEYDGMTSGLTARFPLQIGTQRAEDRHCRRGGHIARQRRLITNLRFGSADVGTGGVGAAPVAGEWQGITIDQYAHDRNVETILELESPTSDGTGNATPSKAQTLGSLGPQEKAGDETLRLGFTVHGVIGQPSDVDVYSFSARAGTEIWVDIDRTWHSLNSVVELIDNLGNVLARSQDSPLESLGDGTAGNIGRRMQKVLPFEGVDHFTTNPRDAGMRLVLPGPANSTNTYHVRIRSNAGAQVTSVPPGGFPTSTSEVRVGGPTTVATTTQGGAGVNEVQQVTIPGTTTAGTFTLTFETGTTALIPVTATAADVQAALEALSNLVPGDVLVTGGARRPLERGVPWGLCQLERQPHDAGQERGPTRRYSRRCGPARQFHADLQPPNDGADPLQRHRCRSANRPGSAVRFRPRRCRRHQAQQFLLGHRVPRRLRQSERRRSHHRHNQHTTSSSASTSWVSRMAARSR